MSTRIIHLHAAAPAQPAPGAACNGCGVCCASEPCPLGVLASRRRQGPCAALDWHEEEQRYRCGLLAVPAGAGRAARLRARLAARWIAAGQGCDCTLLGQRAEPSA